MTEKIASVYTQACVYYTERKMYGKFVAILGWETHEEVYCERV